MCDGPKRVEVSQHYCGSPLCCGEGCEETPFIQRRTLGSVKRYAFVCVCVCLCVVFVSVCVFFWCDFKDQTWTLFSLHHAHSLNSSHLLSHPPKVGLDFAPTQGRRSLEERRVPLAIDDTQLCLHSSFPHKRKTKGRERERRERGRRRRGRRERGRREGGRGERRKRRGKEGRGRKEKGVIDFDQSLPSRPTHALPSLPLSHQSPSPLSLLLLYPLLLSLTLQLIHLAL